MSDRDEIARGTDLLNADNAGEHPVRARLAVQIKDLKLQSLGGPDANANGVKDWVETSIAAMAGVDHVGQASLPVQSFISPACIEGKARYAKLARISNIEQGISNAGVEQGAGARWYANTPLNEDDLTDISVSFQNGALEIPVSVIWKPYNLMEHNGETLFIRKGDALRLTCIDPARAFEDREHARGGRFTLDAFGGQYQSNNTRPVTCQVTNAGVFTVSGEYTHGNDAMTASVTIQVLDGVFPEENPACLVGRQREWSFTGMPSNAVYETDNTVELAVTGVSLITNNQEQITLSLKASEANKPHVLIARTSPGGAIMNSTELNSCWIQNAADGYAWVAEVLEDSQLWEIESVQHNLPDSVDIRIKVVVGGVTLDDYTLERWITNADYDGTGVYRFRLFHPNNQAASTCHTFMAYQNGQFIGEVFGGEQE
jgi:hypothetical protein